MCVCGLLPCGFSASDTLIYFVFFFLWRRCTLPSYSHSIWISQTKLFLSFFFSVFSLFLIISVFNNMTMLAFLLSCPRLCLLVKEFRISTLLLLFLIIPRTIFLIRFMLIIRLLFAFVRETKNGRRVGSSCNGGDFLLFPDRKWRHWFSHQSSSFSFFSLKVWMAEEEREGGGGGGV